VVREAENGSEGGCPAGEAPEAGGGCSEGGGGAASSGDDAKPAALVTTSKSSGEEDVPSVDDTPQTEPAPELPPVAATVADLPRTDEVSELADDGDRPEKEEEDEDGGDALQDGENVPPSAPPPLPMPPPSPPPPSPPPPSLLSLEEHTLLDIFGKLDAVDILNVAQTSVAMYSRVDVLFGLGSSSAGVGGGGGGGTEEDDGGAPPVSTAGPALHEATTAAVAAGHEDGEREGAEKIEESGGAATEASVQMEDMEEMALEDMEDLFDNDTGIGGLDHEYAKYADFEEEIVFHDPGRDDSADATVENDATENRESPTPPAVAAAATLPVPAHPDLTTASASASAPAPTSTLAQKRVAGLQDAFRTTFSSKFLAKGLAKGPAKAPVARPDVPQNQSPPDGGTNTLPNAFLSLLPSKVSAQLQPQKSAAKSLREVKASFEGRQAFAGIDPATASSMADKLLPAELGVIIDMTERVRQAERTAADALAAAVGAATREGEARKERDVLAGRVEAAEGAVAAAAAGADGTEAAAAGDAEVVSFLEEGARALEAERDSVRAGKEKAEAALEEGERRHGERVKLLEDSLVYEREKGAEVEEGAWRTRRVLAREVRRCRTELAVMQTERDGYRDQLKALKRAVMENGGRC